MLSQHSLRSVSEHIYNNSDGNGPYRSYCRQQIETYLPEIGRTQWLKDQVARGGVLAVELFEASKVVFRPLEDVTIVWPPAQSPKSEHPIKKKKRSKHDYPNSAF